MKKKLFLLYTASLCLFGFFYASAHVLAQNPATAHIDNQTAAFLGSRGVGVGTQVFEARSVVANIVQGALGIIGTLFVAYAFYGGMMILTAAGDEDKVDTGKSTLRTATIGIIVVLSALGITTFISTIVLNSTGATEPEQGFSIDQNYAMPIPPPDPTRGQLFP